VACRVAEDKGRLRRLHPQGAKWGPTRTTHYKVSLFDVLVDVGIAVGALCFLVALAALLL
jgi:hypothetical protein